MTRAMSSLNTCAPTSDSNHQLDPILTSFHHVQCNQSDWHPCYSGDTILYIGMRYVRDLDTIKEESRESYEHNALYDPQILGMVYNAPNGSGFVVVLACSPKFRFASLAFASPIPDFAPALRHGQLDAAQAAQYSL